MVNLNWGDRNQPPDLTVHVTRSATLPPCDTPKPETGFRSSGQPARLHTPSSGWLYHPNEIQQARQ